MGWVDENIKIDFELPKDIREIADECEKLAAEKNYAYDNYIDLLWIMCKEAYRVGHMTKKQWETVEARYFYGLYVNDEDD